MDSAPVAGATVSFSPDGEGTPASGRTDASGRYVLTALQGGGEGKGTTPGKYIVIISKMEVVPLNPPKKAPHGGPPITEESVNRLPNIYKDRKAAKLTANVVAGKNKFDFELKSTEK